MTCGRVEKSLVKRLVKGPWLWIVVAVVAVLLALQFFTPSGGYDEITTSEMEKYVTSGQVKEVTFVDGDQVIKATLAQGVDRDGGDKVQANWIDGQQQGIIELDDQAVADGTIEKSNSENPQP